MKNGTPPHVDQCARQVFQQFSFRDRIISRHFAVSWPPRYPDPIPIDFWFWGYLNSKVYSPGPRHVSEMIVAIKRKVMKIHPIMLSSGLLSTFFHVQFAFACKGGTLKICNSNESCFPFPFLCCH